MIEVQNPKSQTKSKHEIRRSQSRRPVDRLKAGLQQGSFRTATPPHLSHFVGRDGAAIPHRFVYQRLEGGSGRRKKQSEDEASPIRALHCRSGSASTLCESRTPRNSKSVQIFVRADGIENRLGSTTGRKCQLSGKRFKNGFCAFGKFRKSTLDSKKRRQSREFARF